MQTMFQNCKSLNNLDLHMWETSKLINMSGFLYGSTVRTFNLNGWDTSHVTNFADAFRNMPYITDIDISYLDFSSAINISYLFNENNNIKTINAKNLDTSKVTTFQGTFRLCYATWIDITGWDMSSLQNWVQFFYGTSAPLTLVGDATYEDVVEQNIKTYKNLNISIPAADNIKNLTNLNRASLRAIINGVADRSGQTALTMNLNNTQKSKLSAEDIAVATNKNWTIA